MVRDRIAQASSTRAVLDDQEANKRAAHNKRFEQLGIG